MANRPPPPCLPSWPHKELASLFVLAEVAERCAVEFPVLEGGLPSCTRRGGGLQPPSRGRDAPRLTPQFRRYYWFAADGSEPPPSAPFAPSGDSRPWAAGRPIG